MTDSKVFITKASGEKQLFSEEKLRRSLQRSKAGREAVNDVVQTVRARLRDGITTREIYDLAYATLRQQKRSFAARYSLKRAIMEMGPDGHPFERYVAELIKTKGYSVKTGQSVPGRCVMHEVDVVAEKGDERVMVECKFHNQPGIKSDVKVALYVQARFEDIGKKFHQAWLVTNTELTSDAIRYAECVGMKAIGWNYPPDGSLGSWVESAKLHPVTCLTSLSQSQKKTLLKSGVILCRDIHPGTEILKQLRLGSEEQADLLAEIKNLCDGAAV